jgi:hypothetical protein
VPDRLVNRRHALGQDPSPARQSTYGAALGRAPQPRRTPYRAPAGPRPDRVAGWAVALGVFLVLVAGATSRADTGSERVAPSGEERRALVDSPTTGPHRSP